MGSGLYVCWTISSGGLHPAHLHCRGVEGGRCDLCIPRIITPLHPQHPSMEEDTSSRVKSCSAFASDHILNTHTSAPFVLLLAAGRYCCSVLHLFSNLNPDSKVRLFAGCKRRSVLSSSAELFPPVIVKREILQIIWSKRIDKNVSFMSLRGHAVIWCFHAGK